MQTDVVVVGLGAFGSAALWRLAARGVNVVGIERQGIGHPFGSSHGTTRLFRVACMEHPGLTEIARKSLALWTELGERTGETYVRQTGSLNVGGPNSRPVQGARQAAADAGAPTTDLTHDELHSRFPQYNLASDDEAVWDPGAGICYAEPTVRAQVADAQRLGAKVYEHTMVTAVEVGRDAVTIRTPTLDITADQVVISTGAWLSKLAPTVTLSPRRTPLFWFQPKDPASDAFQLRNFPSFIWEFADGKGLWGHGSDEDFLVKVGLDGAERDRDVDPDELDRYIHPRKDITELSAAIADHFPELDPEPVKLMPCMVTDSLDGQFLVGRTDERVVIAGGDSGHGFKHCAGVGELLAQITTKETPYTDVSFVDPLRF
ncbi:N-methyl-L-tryptophan oxidase [Kribbella speibonae]|uniref:N-methyl-L-tryptophan oxidase n=1 Tax=Kribbella speibonae TaxID=1572660 RepID=A0A4R0IUH0_9ACTN|nr:N-methyl-L-tryptophan oxidase [Kribbella speibonae]TCC25459.1 N-methyl-L-tryptophan oxidase [Kribbella speibonae]TCC37581.1 N-methyl-L-tryptophan oxidase [Kribbella speibonae]